MAKVELRLLLLLSVVGITLQTPYSHHPDYSLHSDRSYSRSRAPYSASRYASDRYDDEDDRLDRAESRHSRHKYEHRESQPRHPVEHKQHSRDDHHDLPPIHHPRYEFNLRSHDSHHDALEDPYRNKRQAFLPYFPYYAYLPPIYQVHNIYLTPPGYRCYPTSGPSGFPQRPTSPPETATPDPNIISKFGLTNTTDTSEATAPKQPSKCVWSIVACCSPGSKDIRYACFELLGCPGAFWDVNPCDDRVVTAAANSALKYYMNNQAPTTEPTFQNL